MMLQEETSVPLSALPMAAFRAHLRLGSGFGEDTLQDEVLESFLRAAIATIEARTGKALIARDFVLTLEAWKSSQAQPLPVAPVASVTGVKLVDANGVDTALAATAYRLVEDASAPRLVARGAALPTLASGNSAEVSFVAGYGGWDAVPADLAQAVMLLASHYYEFRHETQLGQGCMPFGVTALLEKYRVMRVGFGGEV